MFWFWIVLYLVGLTAALTLVGFYTPPDTGSGNQLVIGLLTVLWPLTIIFGLVFILASLPVYLGRWLRQRAADKPPDAG